MFSTWEFLLNYFIEDEQSTWITDVSKNLLLWPALIAWILDVVGCFAMSKKASAITFSASSLLALGSTVASAIYLAVMGAEYNVIAAQVSLASALHILLIFSGALGFAVSVVTDEDGNKIYNCVSVGIGFIIGGLCFVYVTPLLYPIYWVWFIIWAVFLALGVLAMSITD